MKIVFSFSGDALVESYMPKPHRTRQQARTEVRMIAKTNNDLPRPTGLYYPMVSLILKRMDLEILTSIKLEKSSCWTTRELSLGHAGEL